MATHKYDLVIVGAGSGNMLPAPEFADWRIAVVEADRFGGTCLNRGCIPSKMLASPAASMCSSARPGSPDLRVLSVGDDELRADRFVLAAGSRPVIPPLPGLAEVPYLTSDTVMRLDALPKSMVVLGGGYIAAEMSHIFGSLGTQVTIIARGGQLLARHDLDIRARFTEAYAGRFDVRLGATPRRVSATRKGIRVDLATPSGPQQAVGQVLLVATGRTPNSDSLNVAAAGIEVDVHGHVRTDDTLRAETTQQPPVPTAIPPTAGRWKTPAAS